MSRPDYHEYIKNSEVWAAKRKERLGIDQYRCRKCSSTSKLEVHHRTYQNLGAEPMDDLVTVCEDCHREIHKIVEHMGKSRSDEKFLARVTATYLGEPVMPAEPRSKIRAPRVLTSYKQAQKAIQKLKAPNGKRYFLRRINGKQEPALYRLAYRADSGATVIEEHRPGMTADQICQDLTPYAKLSSKRRVAPAERSQATGGAISSRIAVPGRPRSKNAGQTRDHTLSPVPEQLGDYKIELLGETIEGNPIVILKKAA